MDQRSGSLKYAPVKKGVGRGDFTTMESTANINTLIIRQLRKSTLETNKQLCPNMKRKYLVSPSVKRWRQRSYQGQEEGLDILLFFSRK